MPIESYRAESPPENRSYGDCIQAGIVRGNAGSLVIINMGEGEVAEHRHEQEHVGVVLEGEFSFTYGDEEVLLRRGDLYRVPADQPHGVRCADRAVIAQVREPSGVKAGCTCCG
jgi:mannose-6-phosphate isomerase-like protein (cupin superfamily)